jgi:hypothetical protein
MVALVTTRIALRSPPNIVCVAPKPQVPQQQQGGTP